MAHVPLRTSMSDLKRSQQSVVDNASSDGSVEMLGYLAERIARVPSR